MNPSPRILIVDDAATVRMFHRVILLEAGYTVDEAVNGVEALEKAIAAPYDLYLVDVNMPKLDGYNFLRRLRQEPIPQVPAIMITTEAQPQDRRKALEAGANFYLIKPAKPELLQTLCQILTTHRERSAP
ncbi:MAG: response regulator [Hydrogenophilus sp.]|nr:response regulator [Hydrogenophilus sp.]